jgi:hypothetical protein
VYQLWTVQNETALDTIEMYVSTNLAMNRYTIRSLPLSAACTSRGVINCTYALLFVEDLKASSETLLPGVK